MCEDVDMVCDGDQGLDIVNSAVNFRYHTRQGVYWSSDLLLQCSEWFLAGGGVCRAGGRVC
jgi:hypothetical protein